MESLDLEGLKEACRSDVDQIYRLWGLYRAGKVVVPEGSRRGRRAAEVDPDEYLGPGPGEHMPRARPNCRAVGTWSSLRSWTSSR